MSRLAVSMRPALVAAGNGGNGWRGASQAITPPSFISALAARSPARGDPPEDVYIYRTKGSQPVNGRYRVSPRPLWGTPTVRSGSSTAKPAAVSPETGQCETISLLVRSVWEYKRSAIDLPWSGS